MVDEEKKLKDAVENCDCAMCTFLRALTWHNIDKTVESEEKTGKVKTGNARLDDLLFGGIPFGTNALVYGPAFVGKEVLVNQFMAEGLRRGIPAIWVLTDTTPTLIREEMEHVLPDYHDYEKRDLVTYVDAYSKSVGAAAEDGYNTLYVNKNTNEISKSVDNIAQELKKKHGYYRLVFRSISTLIAYLDAPTAFRFLQPFAGKRKMEKAVSMFVIGKGMHSETDIQMLGSVMDGSIDFRLEQLQTFLCVKGIGDVQSRAWIRYTHTKKGVTIGSFALGHVR